MFLTGASLLVLLLCVYLGVGGRRMPLERAEILRVRRLSERLRREETLPFD